MRAPTKLALLASLYFVQGLPFGFQATALPVLLRRDGVSLEAIGLVGVLALPWMLKALWAPWVDRHFHPRVGPRRSWILPLQGALVLAALVGAWAITREHRAALLATVFAMNLIAATLDVAVDGLAIDLLEPRELGYGNIAQVVGYKLGMLTGGGLLLWASARVGEAGLFLGMAAVVAVLLVPIWRFEETKHSARGAHGTSGPTVRAVLEALREWARGHEARWLLAFVGTYKVGEAMADAMWKPFLVDAGFTPAEIGLWVGTWGGGASLLGSVTGGLAASRLGIGPAVALTAALRVVPLAGEWWISLQTPGEAAVIAVTVGEHFFGGALTTAVFALMMSRVDRRMAATHYTAIATIEVLGKSPAAWASGFLVAGAGYPALFAAAAALSFAFLALVPRGRSQEPLRA